MASNHVKFYPYGIQHILCDSINITSLWDTYLFHQNSNLLKKKPFCKTLSI